MKSCTFTRFSAQICQTPITGNPQICQTPITGRRVKSRRKILIMMRLQGIARARWNGPFSLKRTRSRDRQPSIYNRPRDRQPWTLCCIYHRVKRFCLRVLHNQSSSFERHARLRQRGALFLAKCKYTRCPGSNHHTINRCTPERLGFSDFRPSMSPCRQSPTRDITEAGSREGKCTLCCDCRFNPIEKMSV